MPIYTRGTTLYFDWVNGDGKRKQKSSGYRIGQEKDAERALAILERAAQAERDLRERTTEAPDAIPAKGVTFGAYARYWLKERQKNKPQAAKEDRWKLERFILPALERFPLADIRTRHTRGFVFELKARKMKDGEPELAPRTIRSIWSCLRSMMQDAVVDEFIPQTPCVLKHGDLPPVEDKDPDWRAGAIYTREEVEALISDERIPFHRRVRNGLLFLAGFRPSEAFALRLKHYTHALEPLGRLDLMRAFNTALKKEKALKVAAKRRLVPVHPTLARLLAEWLLSGWEAYVGRKPGPDDLLIPNPKGNNARVDDAYQEMLEDQELLGWRKRRLYDARRTFISLVQADGASKNLLRWVTHGPKSGEVIDIYTEIPWPELCREVAKLRVSLRGRSPIVELRRASGTPFRDSRRDIPLVVEGNALDSESRHPDLNRGPTDYESATTTEVDVREWNLRKASAGLPASAPTDIASPPRPPVTGAVTPLDRRRIAVKLQAALTAWMEGEDLTTLRARLTRLLGALQ